MITRNIKSDSSASSRSYSSIYDIKDFVRTEFMPKYFPMDEVNDLNVGLLGFNTDLVGTIAEDSYNTVTTFIQEMYPNTAYLPETLYTNAALFRMDDLMARPAVMSIILLIQEDAIQEYGIPQSGFIELRIDRETLIDVEGMNYMLDYDLIIQAKPAKGGQWIYTTLYDYSFKNSLNTSTESPYVKNISYNSDDGRYLGIMCNVHQVVRNDYEDIIISNSVINYPKFPIDYEDQLGNFEVFYREPTSNTFIQLEKVLKNAPPIMEPFCYYTFKDENTIEISFSNKSKYFQPKFNSDIRVEMYTTKGLEGNFPIYKGNTSNISVLTTGEKYDYNTKLILNVLTQSDSSGGLSQPDFDTIQRIVSEKFATVNSITTETDLQLSFANTKFKTGIDISFIKKRDDAFERLFSAFSLYKDSDNELYHMNTLDMFLGQSEFDVNEVDRLVIYPGAIFKYRFEEGYDVNRFKGLQLYDNLDLIDEKFLFVNPLLIYIFKDPNIIGFYLNSVDLKNITNYSYINTGTTNQFISNNIIVKRNTMMAEDSYTFEISITPTTEMNIPLFDDMGNWLNNIKCKLFIKARDGRTDLGYIDFNMLSYDEPSNIITFQGSMLTDDVLSIDEEIRCQVKDEVTGMDKFELIPYSGLVVDAAVFVKEPIPIPHQYEHLEDLRFYTLSNKYTTKDNPIDLVIAYDYIKSTLEYEDLRPESQKRTIVLSSDFNVGEGIVWEENYGLPIADMTQNVEVKDYNINGAINLYSLRQDKNMELYNLKYIHGVRRERDGKGIIVGDRVLWGWGGDTSLGPLDPESPKMQGINSSIRGIRAIGGDVSIRIGGPNGVNIWEVSDNHSILYNTYKEIINDYGLTQLEIYLKDIDPTNTDHTFNARALKNVYNDTAVNYTFTLDLLTSGIGTTDIDMLNIYLNDFIPIKKINLMIPEFDLPEADRLPAIKTAIEAAAQQLFDLFIIPRGDNIEYKTIVTIDDIYAMLGCVINIGTGQLYIWTPEMTKDIVDYCIGKNISRIDMDSINEDAMLIEDPAITEKYLHIDELKRFHFNIPEPEPVKPDTGIFVKLLSVPLVSARDIKLRNKYSDLLSNLNTQYKYLTETTQIIENNYNIDLKFIGTYGRSKIFETETGEKLDSINCSVTFDIKFIEGVTEELSIPMIREAIVEFFNNININGDNSIKASNIIQKLENDFPEIDYLKFVSFNQYPSSVQVLINTIPDPVLIADDSILFFVPEYITLREDNVYLNVI